MNRRDLNFVFQNSDKNQLNRLYEKISSEQKVIVIQEPTSQTIMLPVKDPVSGGTFYAGEVLVTTSTVEVNGSKGWAMVMDDNPELSLILSMIDGCFASGLYTDLIESLYISTLTKISDTREKINQMVNSTKVSFDLM
ncbi:phosphonate C-P lyase system protein PhnG [Flexistipes sp.]|uniref:phosphonate C-P lyase system protein PhnG n=1 Tax=Flexistipes sp. TaxID=3088135 RepID=UPI002E234559|nr:phosphonate C-P lyase system protein PhnG [Flexistipes sp.]